MEEVERSGYNRRFKCLCDCGSETIKFLGNLRLGRSKSCATNSGCPYWMDHTGTGRAAIIAKRRAVSQETAKGRICLTCDTWKTWSSFSSDKRRSSGKASNCMDCGRWRGIEARYGMSRIEWLRLWASQHESCALCREPQGKRRLSIDHNHECCGEDRACPNCIRGMLCDGCNRMVGLVERKPETRKRFADYLDARPLLDQ